MSYFFKVVYKNHQGIVFSNDEYLCETTTKAELLSLSLPSFYKIQNFTDHGSINFLYIFPITNFFTKRIAKIILSLRI